MNILKNKNIFSNFEGTSSQIACIKKFFGERIIDTFIHFPINIKAKNLKKIIENDDIDKFVTIDLIIVKHQKPFNKKSPYKVSTKTSLGQKINILYFGGYKNFYTKKLLLNEKYRITGKIQFFGNNFQFIHPKEILNSKDLIKFENIEPEYNLSRTKINNKFFRKFILKNIEILNSYKFPNEWINDKYLEKNKWLNFKKALLKIHNPLKLLNKNESESIRKRLAYDEILSNFLIFNSFRQNIKENKIKIKNFSLSQNIKKKIPFKLTPDQNKTLEEINNDLTSKKKMYRLIQGDVGSGKTIISLLAISDMINSGYQCVLMAPTELLAKQHYEYFFEYFNSFNINIALLTSKIKNKSQIIKGINNSTIKLLIGTHAVYNKELNFNNLGLVIIDEQHKFGVNQRTNLLEKSSNCHTLIMSATPIPRSLSFALYGEIDVSTIKSKPEGRNKVTTSIISNNQLKNLIQGIDRKIINNEQVFWVLPHIGDSENEDKKGTVITRYNFLKKIFGNKVGIIHGKMSNEEIDKNMDEFKKKKKMILISTTVIEVGINIPSATLIVIEEANRFGLAQLHQLRGRIARSSLPSNCVLLHDHNLSENAVKRLLILKNSNDGFKIAEKDLELRGAGDFFGTNQSGMPRWRFFRHYEDLKMLEEIKKNCNQLLLDKRKNKDIIDFLVKVFYGKKKIINYSSV